MEAERRESPKRWWLGCSNLDRISQSPLIEAEDQTDESRTAPIWRRGGCPWRPGARGDRREFEVGGSQGFRGFRVQGLGLVG